MFLKPSPEAFLSFVCVLGLIIGSFLNVVILRLPRMLRYQWTLQCYDFLQQDLKSLSIPQTLPDAQLNLFTPRSRCPHCDHQLRVWENIPLLSFLLLRGKCLVCHRSISWRYPLIEILAALFGMTVAHYYGVSWQTAAALILTWALLVAAVIDIEHQLLPDNITLPLLWLGLIVNLRSFFTDIHHAIIGAIVGYLFLWSVYWLFKLITHKEGMGYGDFKLLAMLGAWLGWQALPGIILISCVTGTIFGISLIALKRHQRSQPLPFGPFIAMAGWIMLIWGNKLNHLYISFAGYT